jgi:hypothetical protein
MRRPILTLLALLAATAAGCGQTNAPSQDFSGAEEDVAEVVEDLQVAAQEDETRRICTDLLSGALSRRLGDRCPQVVAAALDDTDTFEVSADSVRIAGQRARVRVTTGRDGDEEELLVLVNERGDWRIDEFAGPVRS